MLSSLPSQVKEVRRRSPKAFGAVDVFPMVRGKPELHHEMGKGLSLMGHAKELFGPSNWMQVGAQDLLDPLPKRSFGKQLSNLRWLA